jgi:hypothetical protein
LALFLLGLVGIGAGVGGMIANGVMQDKYAKEAVKNSGIAAISAAYAEYISSKAEIPRAIPIK